MTAYWLECKFYNMKDSILITKVSLITFLKRIAMADHVGMQRKAISSKKLFRRSDSRKSQIVTGEKPNDSSE